MIKQLSVCALLYSLLALAALNLSAAEKLLVSLPTKTATFEINAGGSLAAILRQGDRRNFLASNQPAPLLAVRVDGKFYSPDGAKWNARKHEISLGYTAVGVTALVRAEAKASHVIFEVVDVQPKDRVELVVWGPYPTTIGDIIGEVVGVVRDPEFAVGIQSLNAKTLGGYPAQENDIGLDGKTMDDPGKYPNLPPELNKEQNFRGDTAWPAPFGSVLQAYCRNRNHDRIIENWGHEKYLAPAFNDGGVIGSKIALFACPAAQALETLGKIEVAEGLPHPLLDGVWGKVSPQANCAYLIVDFGEDTIDRAIEMTKKAGLNYLYHSSPFESWGHFVLKKKLFPHGWDGLKMCVEKARRAGIRVGFHTLSNFITPNDTYVSPKPDPRLARIGASTLTGNIDAADMEIPVAAPDYFGKQTAMNTVVIGDELVAYDSVSTNAPWRLLNCKRGAWHTQAAAHASGDSVAKLMDHPYKVFLTDADLTQEVARNIASLCNAAGTMQISLDGLEGAWSTGMGQYGRTLLTTTWYNALKPELRGTINDASNPGHFNWHVATRMNWGEPWYAGFRKSQTLYRFKNQVFFERNLMPHMLGWFAVRPDTTVEDTEWMLARAAGYDAGFALATSLASAAQLDADANSADAMKKFGAMPAILKTVKTWESARMAGAFPSAVKALLRDNTKEFHLEAAGEGTWDLYPMENGNRGTPVRIKAP